MKNKPGLLFIINELAPGGAEMFIVRLAKYLQENFNIFVITVLPQNNDSAFIAMMEKEVEFKLIRYEYSIPKGFQQWIAWKINAIACFFGIKHTYKNIERYLKIISLQRIIKSNNIQVINTSSGMSDNIAVNYFKKHYNLPIQLTMHSSYNKDFWNTLGEERIFFEHTQQLFEQTDFIFYTADFNIEIFNHFQNYKGPIPEKLYLGYEAKQAKNIRNELQIPEDAFVCTMMARGIPEKGWNEACEAFCMLQKNIENVYFIAIANDTEYIQELKNQYKTNSHILFTGYIADPSNYLFSSDCTILPSYFPESLPYTITESLAYKKPVLTTKVGETEIMITADNSKLAGCIIPFTSEGKASVVFLFKKLYEYAINRELLNCHQELASIAFQKFSMDYCGNRYKEVLLKIINK